MISARHLQIAGCYSQPIDDLFYGRASDLALRCRVAEQERVITNVVDDPWNARGSSIDQTDRLFFENVDIVGAGNLEPEPYISIDLEYGERLEHASERHPLLELSKLRLVQQEFELRLSAEHDLKQLLLVGLEVEKQANLLKQRHREPVRLIDNQGGLQPLLVPSHEEAAKLVQRTRFG